MADTVYLNLQNKKTCFYIVIEELVIQNVWMCENSSDYIHLKFVHFTVSKLYLNYKKKKRQQQGGFVREHYLVSFIYIYFFLADSPGKHLGL